jgi:hypothetical protein
VIDKILSFQVTRTEIRSFDSKFYCDLFVNLSGANISEYVYLGLCVLMNVFVS